MLQALFHAWERRLASVTTDRVVRPFDWGTDWLAHAHGAVAGPPADLIGGWVSEVMADTDAFYTPAPTADYTLAPGLEPGEERLTFPSAFETPHRENNTVQCRVFRAKDAPGTGHRAAVLVLLVVTFMLNLAGVLVRAKIRSRIRHG